MTNSQTAKDLILMRHELNTLRLCSPFMAGIAEELMRMNDRALRDVISRERVE